MVEKRKDEARLESVVSVHFYASKQLGITRDIWHIRIYATDLFTKVLF